MNFKKSQSGRSMVEMLGVLAIIGVLSVGGIAGYSLSMRRHRANSVVDLASKYALVLYGNCQKKILDGEVSSAYYCGNGSHPTFADAGVGNIPAGVEFTVNSDGSIKPMFGHNPTTGVDSVGFSAHFDDDKLCQAVASITGSTCNDGTVQIWFNQN